MNSLIIDLDGTLTDPRQGILACIRYALCKLGRAVPADDQLERFIGPPLQHVFAELVGSSERPAVLQAVAYYRERFSEAGIFENAVYPGIPEALSHLDERGMRLFLASTKPRVFAERILAHFRLDGYFHAIWGSELDGTRSDKSELIAHILSEHRLACPATAMVGDRMHDIRGALANGLIAVGALWGYGSRQELESAGASILLEQPSDLARLVI